MNGPSKVFIGVLAAFIVVLVGGGAAFGLFVKSVNDNLTSGVTEEELLAIQEKLVSSAGFDEPFYMMLIGSDRRLGDSSMGARSDTNIVVRVDAPNSTVTLISIPRDTKINIPGYGTNKFNAAYAYGGTAGAIDAASKLLGVDISHYAEVNFETLTTLVDSVGGVEVNVPVAINDPMAGDVSIPAGTQTLDGEAALVFARSRAYADGDYTRASNQRLLIEALVNKVLALPATELPGVVLDAAACVTTDMSATELFSLAAKFQNLGELKIYSIMVPSYVQMIDGISYVVTDTSGLNAIMDVVEQGADPNTVEVSGATGSSIKSTAE